jgi:hypothetical protein
MGLMAWLFPGVEMQRQETLARIEWDKRRREAYQTAMRPVWDLAHEALPLIEEAELAGRLPTFLTIPRERFRDLVNGLLAQDDYFGRSDFMQNGMDGARLLGLRLKVGEKLGIE